MKCFGLKSTLLGLVLAASALCSAAASATILLEQPPSATFNGMQTDASTGMPLSETFSLTGPVLIEKISWWGYDLGGIPGAVNDFVVDFAAVTQTGTITESPDVGGLTLYQMTLGSGFAFGGGTTTLSLINNSFDVEWYWQGTDSQKQSLRLEGVRQGQPVPEPEILSLFGLALAGVAFVSRRSRRPL